MASVLTYDSQLLTKEVEQRWKTILDVFPGDDLPVVRDAEKVPGQNSIISWDQENLSLPSAVNSRIEGANYTYTGTTGSKLTNYVQEIMNGDQVTMLNDMSFHPGIGGVNSRVKRTAMLMMQRSIMDLEWALVNGTAAIGNSGAAPAMGGIPNFAAAAYTTTQTTKQITYNDDTAAPSLVTILGKNWTDGAKMDRLLVNFTQKAVRIDAFSISGYVRNTNLATDGTGTGVLTVERVVTAAGAVEVVPHPLVASGVILGYQKRAVKVIEVKGFARDNDVARLGSTIPVVVIGWYSAYVGNQRSILKATGYTV